MKVIVQRSKEAKVKVNGLIVGYIPKGLVLLIGVTHDDTEEDARYLAEKIVNLRIFEDDEGKMNRSVKAIEGQILSVSQFTLYADCRKGRRPNFMSAARPEQAEAIYEAFNEAVRKQGLVVKTGVFGSMMDVELTNWGPVTLIVES